MQTGRRRRHRAALLCIDGLITLGVVGRVGARDVRGKWDVAVLLDRLLDRQLRVELHYPGAALGRRKNLGLEIIGDGDDSSGLELAAGMHHRLPHRFAEWAEQQDLGVGAVVAESEEPGAETPRRVEDQRVAGGIRSTMSA